MVVTEEKIAEEDYLVKNKREIAQILKTLKDEITSIRISFDSGDQDYYTNIISVDTQNDKVHFDLTVDEAFNKRLLGSHELTIQKDKGVRIKWKSTQHSLSTLIDGHALTIPMPESIVRLQRRELFRLKTPMSTPIPCELSIPGSDLSNPEHVTYGLVDVSLGGVGLIAEKELHPAIEVGRIFDQCKITFPDIGSTTLSLEVKNIVPLEGKDSKKHRIGLAFFRPNRTNESIIQKYTFNLERAMLVAKNRT